MSIDTEVVALDRFTGPLKQGSAVTREQKLALIIGFSLILAVGVLISDHLSRAQLEPIVTDQNIDMPMVLHSIADVPPGAGESSRPMAGRDTVLLDPGLGSIPIRNSLPGMNRSQPMEVSQPPIEVASRMDDVPNEPVRAGISIPSQTNSARIIGNQPLELAGFVSVSDDIQPRFSGQSELSRQAGSITEPTPSRPAVTHKVESGDSLYAIAQKYYGDGNLWPELAKANTSLVNAKGHVLTGVSLIIPQREGAAFEHEAAQVPTQTQTRTAQTPPETGAFGSYTIKKGDTLSEISQDLMGTVKRMNELIELNRDKINDANDIREGMKLRYPRGQRA